MVDNLPNIQQKYQVLQPILNERQLRIWLATEAMDLGRGGIERVHEATGVCRKTIRTGIDEIKNGNTLDKERQRKKGAGRKSIREINPQVSEDLDKLIEPVTRGDPENPLRWTCKSALKLKVQLNKMGHVISERTVNKLLHEKGYSLQSNKKTLEGSQHPDRNKQFEHIYAQTQKFLQEQQPVISVDSKKKENIGQFHNNGQEWQLKGQPELVNMHDFPDPKLSKGVPYGVLDLDDNTGWVSVGNDHDTAEFAVESIRRWWRYLGKEKYQGSQRLLIMADGGGSNGSRNRLWKVSLQKFADETGLEITICHFPPGTSKWNKVEHQMFSYISINWRGHPLTSIETMVNLISKTTTETGLKIASKEDNNSYPTGKKISDEEFEELRIEKEKFHGEWNYKIKSRITK